MLKYSNFVNFAPRSKWLICGRGPSLAHYHKFRPMVNFVMACNHTPPPCEPQFLTACEPYKAFRKLNRHERIVRNPAAFFFACDPTFDTAAKYSKRIPIAPEPFQLTTLTQLQTKLPRTRNVSFLATCIALAMGARTVALLGIDLNHQDYENALPSIIADFDNLNQICRREGRQLINLSVDSLLTSVPFGRLEL